MDKQIMHAWADYNIQKQHLDCVFIKISTLDALFSAKALVNITLSYVSDDPR